MARFLLGAVETAAIGKTFARKHGYRLDSNQDFLALAGANLAASLRHGFPTSGGMSQSLVNEFSGARTPLSGFIAALLILVVSLFLTELHETLKKRGIELRLAEAHNTVREVLRRYGFEQHYGPIAPDQTIATILGKTSLLAMGLK